jgi:hypothetical protein
VSAATKCALCDIEITPDNDSKEHIIPEAIGGRRQVRGFLCKKCNSAAGHNWDAAAADQLNFLCLHFAIKRQRGTVPAGDLETQSGEAVRIHSDGHLSLPNRRPVVTESSSTTEINARTHTKNEAEKLLRGMKRRFPKLDVNEAMRNVVEQRKYLREPVLAELQFGGAQSGRSIVKSALALAASSGIESQACEKATSCLRNEDENPCFGYFYSRDLVTNRPLDRVFHCVAIKGDPSSRRLIGYVELFGIYRMVVCLSDHFMGSDVVSEYAIDPNSGRELDLGVDLSLSEEEFRSASSNNENYAAKMVEAFQRAMAIGQAISLAREQRTVIERAVKECCARLGLSAGQTLTSEGAAALSKCIAEQMLPFLENFVFNQRKVGK